MIRINLLPPGITQKRKDERRWVYIVFGGLGVLLIVGAFWGILQLQVISKRGEVDAKVQEAQNLQQQAESFKVFEDRQTDLQARQALANQALANRVSWSRLFSEISLVLPDDVWLDTMNVHETAFIIDGKAIDNSEGGGYKAIAKLLVRVADLEQLQNVWLNSSDKTVFRGKSAIHFIIGTDLVPQNSSSSAAVPAPPSGSGGNR